MRLKQTQSMHLRLKRVNALGFLSHNLKSEWTRKVPLARLLRGWLRGFDSEHILLYDLNDTNWQHHLPDLHRYRFTHATNLHVWPILHDKLIFDAFMRQRLPVIESLFSINEGRFSDNGKNYSWERFFAECRQGTRFVLKAAQGGTGHGLLFVEGQSDGAIVNGRKMGANEFQSLVKGLSYHLAFPFIDTHKTLKQVFPKAGNALRVTAFVGLDGKPRLLAPVFCVGTEQSAPVEHFRHGGLAVQIDEATGRCIKASRRGEDGRLQRIQNHPDTGAALVGLEIPFWPEIRQTLLAFHAANPAFDLVGWDVLIAPDRFYIIEGNHNPGLRIPLMNRNLAEEPEFREFLEARGILSSRNQSQQATGP